VLFAPNPEIRNPKEVQEKPPAGGWGVSPKFLFSPKSGGQGVENTIRGNAGGFRFALPTLQVRGQRGLTVSIRCHCEERSDEAISEWCGPEKQRLPRLLLTRLGEWLAMTGKSPPLARRD